MSASSVPSNAAASPAIKPWMLWSGRIVSALPVLMLLMSATMKFLHKPELVKVFVEKFGYPESTLLGIGVVELLCVLLYAIPRTAVLGAIVLTGYLGGAVATHVRVSDAFLAPILVGVLAWAGLYLRDARIRALIPLNSSR